MKTKVEIAAWGASLVLTMAWVLASASAYAQQAAKVARIGILALPAQSPTGGPAEAVAKALKDLGYVDGKNAVFEFRFANWQTERLSELAAELAGQKVDVIVAITNIPAFAAKKATARVPIVVWASTVPSKPGWFAALPGREAT